MEAQLQEISDNQKASWNKFSGGWKKWDVTVMQFMQPMADKMIMLLHPSGEDMVLDIASGTGEPGLAIASMLNGGKVISTDLAEDMLVIAAEKASGKGITNFEIQTADVSALPFDDNTFDAISCRFGFMFFPDMLMAAKEMYRVLKPGGRMTTAVWNVPEKNFWVTSIMNVINKNMEVPAPQKGATGMFRCAGDGIIMNLFEQAGFNEISQITIDTFLPVTDSHTFWNMHNEVTAPIAAALEKADDAMTEKIKNELFEKLGSTFKDGLIRAEASAVIHYAEK